MISEIPVTCVREAAAICGAINVLLGGIRKAFTFTHQYMSSKTSQHILPTSTNLLGFCLFVITSFHISNKAASSAIDEFISIIALLLAFSCLLSFISIRSDNDLRKQKLEWFADYLFLISLAGIIGIIFLLIFKFIV